MAKKTTRAEENIQAVEEALSKTERFIENNQKTILTVIGVLVVIILAFFAFQRFYLFPKERTAQEQIFMAQKYFNQDSLNLALNGDGINPGFLDIIDDYKWTESANLAHYYAGIIYVKQGEYQAAIDNLEDFDTDDVLVQSMAYGAIGDSYMELGKTDKAIDYYKKAANVGENELTSPAFLMKAGWANEINGNYNKAVVAYKEIKDKYPRSQEAREIDKTIAHAQGKIK
ncbi:tetratricopeptide repeat protein [Candidatus Falkowbacteria bacterium]|nr:tetratricopeptide repeat protein [Candidatus Falkowbacteria bacterium]